MFLIPKLPIEPPPITSHLHVLKAGLILIPHLFFGLPSVRFLKTSRIKILYLFCRSYSSHLPGPL
jgi:hypothetical protein